MEAAPPADDNVLLDTLRALAAPRRLVPILVVATPLVWAQGSLSRDPLAAPLGILMVVSFVLVGPTSWRGLFRVGRHHVPLEAALRLATYAVVGAGVVIVLGVWVPSVFHIAGTLLTARGSLFVSMGLYWVGGWGLARDIDQERRLAFGAARVKELAREAERAQLMAVRSHLDPHFLFNTLNAIAEWAREDGVVAERAILQLSAMLRTVLAGVRAAEWPLAKELELLDTLFALHLLRDPGLFSYTKQVAEDLLSVPVPPLCLLPLAENAVKHGPAAGKRGEIALTVARADGGIAVILENPGAFAGRRDGGEGISMVEKRLALAYDGRARFSIAAAGDRTRAEVFLPAALAAKVPA